MDWSAWEPPPMDDESTLGTDTDGLISPGTITYVCNFRRHECWLKKVACVG